VKCRAFFVLESLIKEMWKIMMKKLVTLGYRMKNSPRNLKKSEIFKEMLISSGVNLVLETRFNVWGGFWNPKKIGEILKETQIGYCYEWEGIKIHQLFGVPKNIRSVAPFKEFSEVYRDALSQRTPDPIATFSRIIEAFPKVEKVAILCCEKFTLTRDNCHRFVLAQVLQERGIVDEVEDLSMDKTSEDLERSLLKKQKKQKLKRTGKKT
jgi:hypothetical protein